MAYEKQTWATGDVITEEKLNHMEDGIASGGVMIVNNNYDENTSKSTLNKTWKEIKDAYINGVKILIHSVPAGLSARESYETVIGVYETIGIDEPFEVMFCESQYSTDSENGYPSFGNEVG